MLPRGVTLDGQLTLRRRAKALVWQLTLMAGGSEKNAADAHRGQQHVASAYVHHMGPFRAGHPSKLSIRFPMA